MSNPNARTRVGWPRAPFGATWEFAGGHAEDVGVEIARAGLMVGPDLRQESLGAGVAGEAGLDGALGLLHLLLVVGILGVAKANVIALEDMCGRVEGGVVMASAAMAGLRSSSRCS